MNAWIDIKAALDTGASGELAGTAWPFGTPDRVGDMIEKGAFKSIKLPMPMLFGHDQNDPVGVWTEAQETNDGLQLKGRLLIDALERAREVHALVRSGAVRGLSIGFTTTKSKRRGKAGRTITELDVLECSLVPVPCHPGAQVASAKSVVNALKLATALNRATAQLSQRKTK